MRTNRTAIALALCACGNAKDPPKAAPPVPAPTPVIDAAPPMPHGPTLAREPPTLPSLTTLAPQPVRGPYKSVAAYCDEQPTENRRGDPMPCNDDRPHVDGPIAIVAPTAPYIDVHLFPVDAGIECSLLMQIDDHVFVADRAIGCDWPGKTGLTIERFELIGGMIVVTWERRSRFSIGGVTTDEVEADALICGVGPSGTPSCTPVIPLRLARTAKGKTRKGAITMVLGTDQSIDLEGDPQALRLDAGDEFRRDAVAGDLGHRRLAFP